MKIFTDPKVYLIAHPILNWVSGNSSETTNIPGITDFFKDMENFGKKNVNEVWMDGSASAWAGLSRQADLLPEFAGRICYCSFGEKQGRKSNQEYLTNIIKSGHGSVLEHVNFTFLIAQCSRGFTHEMVRHRAGFAYSQESTHYIDYTVENGRIILDSRLCKIDELHKTMGSMGEKLFENYQEVYKKLREDGVKKKEACSMARQMLPIGIEAKIVFTGNMRSLRHFVVTRGNNHNVLEIRKIACEVFEILEKIAPVSLHGIKLKKGVDGFDSIVAESGAKV